VTAFAPPGDNGRSSWAISHPQEIGIHPSESEQPVGRAFLCGVDFRLCSCGHSGLGLVPCITSGPQKSAKCWRFRLQQRRAAVSIGSVSLQSHPAPLGGARWRWRAPAAGPTAGWALDELVG
jgi:hypothetical protein